MKKHAQLFLVLAHCLAVVSTFVVHVPVQAMGTELIWTVVTSEDDAGPGTLREAINAVNAAGTGTEISPNAIAFAHNVKTIKLQSLLPTIEAPVLIDGLALVMNGTVVQEGDCCALPTPAEDPCAFSCALRVTIDGSTIPLLTSPDFRYGLEVDSEDVTIRGLRIINITTPNPDSVAIGILLSAGAINPVIECCEVDNIRNTAGTNTNPAFNFAAGIVAGESFFIINKLYIHNIHGGLVNVDCDPIGSSEALVSGSAFGIVGLNHTVDSRIEQIESGSIIACLPGTFGSDGITLIVGTAVGITDRLEGFDPELFRKYTVERTRDCPLQDTCATCNECPLSSSISNHLVERSTITNIIGGSVISNVDNAFIFQDLVAGIFFGTPLSFTFQIFISENTISSIYNGNVTISGDYSECIRIGSRGILLFAFDTNCIHCNIITDINLSTLRAGGYNTRVINGRAHGINGIVSDNPGTGQIFIECNTISHVNGGTAIAEGDCSVILPPGQLIENKISSQIKLPNRVAPAKNVPTGIVCIPSLPAPVSGIGVPLTEEGFINNNTVHSIFGGKRITQGSGSQIVTLGSMGITVGSLPAGKNSTKSVVIDGNSVYSIIGPTLAAQAGNSKIQNIQGTVGIDVNSTSLIIQNNCVEQVTEGPIQVSQNSIVFHATDFETHTLLKKIKSLHTIDKKTIKDPNAVFVPVVTAGISASSPSFNPFFPLSKQLFIQVHNNSVTNVQGAVVPGGQLLLGSIGTGIFAQPAANQLTKSYNIDKNSALHELCADEQALNFIIGDINTNTIQAIAGGTNSPAYGILLDGSQLFLAKDNDDDPLSLVLFTTTNNTIKTVKGNGPINPFSLTNEQLSAVQSCCFDIFGTGTECDLARNYIPFLPFEPTSGIYTLFGGCSQISSNTITKIRDSQTDARGITTAASSDMDIFDNILSQIKGYGIFVGGAFVDTTLPVTGTDFIVEEVLPSLRNKIYNNSTGNNTNKGIELGLIDWSFFIFARTILNVCKNRPLRVHQEAPEDALVTYGNHGQVAPCITKVTCNSNGRITIDVTLTGTLLLTDFIIQFFRNSTNSIPHGEQHISMFDDPQFVLHTDSNGNAHGRFTFLPLVPVEQGDIISAHVTVKNDPLSPAGNAFFGDTSEFSTDTPIVCPVSSLMHQPHKPHKPGFAGLLYRTGEELVN